MGKRADQADAGLEELTIRRYTYNERKNKVCNCKNNSWNDM